MGHHWLLSFEARRADGARRISAVGTYDKKRIRPAGASLPPGAELISRKPRSVSLPMATVGCGGKQSIICVISWPGDGSGRAPNEAVGRPSREGRARMPACRARETAWADIPHLPRRHKDMSSRRAPGSDRNINQNTFITIANGKRSINEIRSKIQQSLYSNE